MADVWRARDTELGRDVAIKVLHENFARDTEFVERFRREASSAAGPPAPERGQRLRPRPVGGHLLHRDGAGRGLLAARPDQPRARASARRSRSPARCSPPRSFAHERGIVHRDLKPMNVLIDRAGRIRVTDFGIARAGNSEITQTGSVMGTAQYLSPEQAQGIEVGAAADIYSIGVMLFEMLTGRVPFDGENAVAIAMKQVAEEPPPPSRSTRRSRRRSTPSSSRRSPRTPPTATPPPTEMSAALDAAEATRARRPHRALRGDGRRGGGRTTRRNVVADRRDRRAAARRRRARLLPDPPRRWSPSPASRARSSPRRRSSCRTPASRSRPTSSESDVPEGTVIEQDPRGGTEAEEGSTVTIIVSLGPGHRRGARRRRPARCAGAKAGSSDAGFEIDGRPSGPSPKVDERAR